MKFNIPLLDRWIINGNCLVGYIYDDRKFKTGTRVQTEAIRFVDILNSQVECLDGKYKLGDPGTDIEHRKDAVGIRPEAKTPEIDKRIFLNPRG